MRNLGLAIIAATAFGLGGCSQNSNLFGKKKPHYHTADGTTIYTEATTSTAATTVATSQTSYDYADQSYNVDTYNSGSYYSNGGSQYSPYTGYNVELYGSQPSYYGAVSYTDPRDVEFVKLNGKSQTADWQNCETLNRGYLFISKYDFSLNPDFEVCMRNKGYVTTTEYGPNSKQKLSAQTSGLRGPIQSTTSYSTYPSNSTSTAYPGYFR